MKYKSNFNISLICSKLRVKVFKWIDYFILENHFQFSTNNTRFESMGFFINLLFLSLAVSAVVSTKFVLQHTIIFTINTIKYTLSTLM